MPIAGSGILSGVYPESLHPSEQRRTLDAQPCGCSFGAADSTFGFAEDAHDLLALLFVIFIDTFRILISYLADRLSHDSGNLFPPARAGAGARCIDARLMEFRERRFQRFTARQDHGALDEVL